MARVTKLIMLRIKCLLDTCPTESLYYAFIEVPMNHYGTYHKFFTGNSQLQSSLHVGPLWTEAQIQFRLLQWHNLAVA